MHKFEYKKIYEELHIQSVGSGGIDLICPMENVPLFVQKMNELHIKIKGFTWWCHVTDKHEPCGMGGPKSQYYSGWFSEIPMSSIISFDDNDKYLQYLLEKWPCSAEYKACYFPGFWIEEDEK